MTVSPLGLVRKFGPGAKTSDASHPTFVGCSCGAGVLEVFTNQILSRVPQALQVRLVELLYPKEGICQLFFLEFFEDIFEYLCANFCVFFQELPC